MPAISFPLQCTGCGAYLQNVDGAAACPFCGASAANSLRVVGVDPVTMLVGEDLLCRQCSYNLRTSPVTGLCPECGQPVSQSLGPDSLRTASPEWIRKVRSGATLLLLLATVGIFLFMFLPIVGIGLIAFTAAGAVQQIGGFQAFFVLIGLIVMGVYLVGLFRITAGDPSAAYRESSTPRVIARACAILPLGFMPFSWILAYQHRAMWMSNPLAGMTSMMVLSCISILLFGIGVGAVAACLRRIFNRASQHASRNLATALIWLTLIATLGLSVGTVVQQIAMQRMFATMRPMMTTSGPATTTAPVFTTATGTTTYSSAGSTTIVLGPSGTIITTTGTATAPALPSIPMPNPAAILVPLAINCASMAGALACYIMWIIVLVRVRRLLAKRLVGVS